MTYAEVLWRMIELMFIAGSNSRWIHISYADRLSKILRRTRQRFATPTPPHGSESEEELLVTRPHQVVEAFVNASPRVATQLMAGEDVDYFLHLAREGGKPVNFIPVIDKDLAWWFKKDSLWYSEFIEAVPDRDIQRTCILQGPVAVRHSKLANEPIGEILGGIHKAIIADLLPQYKTMASIPSIDSIYQQPKLHELAGVRVTRSTKETAEACTVFELISHFQEPVSKWRELLADNRCGTWWDALLTTPEVVCGHYKNENKLVKIFDPRPNTRIEVSYSAASSNDLPIAKEVKVYDGARMVVRATYDPVKSLISVTILHHKTPQVMVPFTRQYLFSSQSWAPIHEVHYSNSHVKNFYAELWFGSVPDKYVDWNIKGTFRGSKPIIRSEVERFCVSIGANPSFTTEDGRRRAIAPIDFHIWLSWEPLMKALFPSFVDADLFNLLHLSYGYKLLSQVPLREDDIATTEVTVTEVVNVRSPLGKRISVRGIISIGDKPMMEMNSQFLFRGEFTDYECTFRISQLQREVFLKDEKAVAILESKQWFVKDNDVVLKVGDYLRFEIETTERHIEGQNIAHVTTTGKVSSHTASSLLLHPVGKVASQVTDTQSDPVRSYLDRHGDPVDPTSFFQDGGYIASPPTLEQRPSFAPRENDTYSVASGDYNPIHTNRYIATLCGLPDTITHGMWTAIHGRKYLERVFRDQVIASYQVHFVDMVKPQEQLVTIARHVGMKNGRRVVEVKVEAGTARTVVLKATAEVEQANTAYVFTGQGSAEPRMGMDMYASSAVAKDLWDRADKHLSAKYGFSILSIVRDNPKELVIHFGSAQGAAIRSNYIALQSEFTVDTPQGPKTHVIPLFPQIHPSSTSYTFSHPQGILFATQFTQPALTLVEKAAFEDMRHLGLVAKSAKFAGHSLGEYAALAAIGNVMPIENLVELVFIRGITMQNATRDDEGRISRFGMVAVNPVRVGPAFTADHLNAVVNMISEKSKKLLQIVNYNVENWQYIVTGHVISLRILDLALTHIHRNPRDLTDVVRVIEGFVTEHVNTDQNQVTLQRGIATIPLPGVDVPFHSRYLLSGVPRFREYLKLTILEENVDMSLLEGKYVPNLTAKPFEISREYVKDVLSLSGSPIMEQVTPP
jgi:fatty acid synthase subunit alpha